MTDSGVMDIVNSFLGTPVSDVEQIIFMLIAGCFLVIVTVGVLDLFKLIGSYIGDGGR
ncbi:hypothetical protein V7O62_09880 [Methanolobus sp. ZRKC2]|uniref:hypothetical protein n=1 Tax=Methanolobus sp. ZRKC2 TaxID=3125783 RepID=UPI003253A43C